MIWVIADTHFYHNRMVDLCGRPENFTSLIIDNWRKVVKGNDLVIHLGDVIFYKINKLRAIMNSLPGKKILVRGNHDSKIGTKHGFDLIVDWIKINGILLTHYPSEGYYGHQHNLGGPRCLSVEKTGYAPVKLESLQ